MIQRNLSPRREQTNKRAYGTPIRRKTRIERESMVLPIHRNMFFDWRLGFIQYRVFFESKYHR